MSTSRVIPVDMYSNTVLTRNLKCWGCRKDKKEGTIPTRHNTLCCFSKTQYIKVRCPLKERVEVWAFPCTCVCPCAT